MNIKIINEKITLKEAKEIGKEFYDEMVKGVVDLERKIIALGGEYHMDANNVLITDGSKQNDVWGFNFYPDRVGVDRIEYKALINIRPAQNNKKMEVESEGIRNKMEKIINKIIR